jgi:hypothetical protein
MYEFVSARYGLNRASVLMLSCPAPSPQVILDLVGHLLKLPAATSQWQGHSAGPPPLQLGPMGPVTFRRCQVPHIPENFPNLPGRHDHQPLCPQLEHVQSHISHPLNRVLRGRDRTGQAAPDSTLTCLLGKLLAVMT